jgi:hypothetical protein
MNSTVVSSKKHDFHTVSNAEFSGVFDCCYYPNYNYHIFIRYGDKIYMEVKDVGEIVISFADLQKNKYWNYYYNLSLLLSNDPHEVAKDLRYDSDYIDYNLYEDKRVWSINTPVIINNLETNTKILDNRDNNCYYKINPFDIERMDYSSPEDLETFNINYMSNNDFQKNIFESMYITYNNIAIEHQTKVMEEMMEELVELSAFFEKLEDKKNFANLVAFYNKTGMNCDLLMIIYNNLLSANGNKMYEPLITELRTCDRLENNSQIIAI